MLYQGVLLKGRGIEKVFSVLIELPDHIFLIIGGGEYEEYYRNLADEMNLTTRVIFLGKLTQEELPKITASADVGVHFRKYSELRNHIEAAFWYEAVETLTEQDKTDLQAIITRAWEKLRRTPIQVPHEEHRHMHLLICSRLENPFVTGILEAYWEAYEAVGLNVFAGGYDYLQEVWLSSGNDRIDL